jgi:tRNA-dihydrouridine synthase
VAVTVTPTASPKPRVRAAVSLHAHTAAQRYSGQAGWAKIAALKEAVTSIPVLGNGDIFSAADALRKVAETGCDGVVVGRGCLGRPWLFGELEAAFAGHEVPTGPDLGEVARVLRRHTELLIEHDGHAKAMRDIRKHMAWYLMGFPVGSELRRGFAMLSSTTQLDDLIAQLDHDAPFPAAADEQVGDRRRVIADQLVCPNLAAAIGGDQ